VRAEHAAVDVRLVDDDEREVREHVAPHAVVRQHADVQHVRVREDQVRAVADRAPLLARGVAVVDRVPEEALADARERARLVLRERLRRVEVERAGARVVREHVEHGEVEGERLAARGAAGDDRVPALRALVGVGLVAPEPLDPGRRERVGERRVEVGGQRRDDAGGRRLDRLVPELVVAAGREHGVPGKRAAYGGHGLILRTA
jgi:hypothetical protein